MGLLDDAIREHLALQRRHGASPEELARKEAEALGPARRVAADEEAPDALDAEAPATDGDPYDDVYAEGDEPEPLDDGDDWDAPEYEPTPAAEADDDVPPPRPEPAAASPEPVGPPAAAAALPDRPGPEPVGPPTPAAAQADRRTPPDAALSDRSPPAGAPKPVGPPVPAPVERDPAAGRFARASERLGDAPPAADESSEPPRRGPGGTRAASDRPSTEAGEDADPDVLEETPEFLQETPEHDRLWFEQKPPRDFDFDD
jgi:hypothetical protein